MPQPTHIAYSDESYYTTERYRSVAVVSLETDRNETLCNCFSHIVREAGVSEFKWSKLAQARERFAAQHLLNAVVRKALDGHLRVDVLIWDTHDSRHAIPGRDDIANLQRMYYHLFRTLIETVRGEHDGPCNAPGKKQHREDGRRQKYASHKEDHVPNGMSCSHEFF